MTSLAQGLEKGVADLGLPPLVSTQIEQLLAYSRLLVEWSKAFNLTAVTGEENVLRRHILDSLSVLPYLRGNRFLDVGTGAGLPGIPLAITRPDDCFVLVDSREKRVHFLRIVIQKLGVSNVSAVCGRVESFGDEAGFSTILSRAFAPLPTFISMTSHLLAPDGVWCAMTGQVVDFEQSCGDLPVTLIEQSPLCIPGEDKARHVVVVGKKT